MLQDHKDGLSPALLSHLQLDSTHVLLSKEAFREILNLIPKDKYRSQFQLHEVDFVSADAVPEVSAFLKRNPQFAARMKPGNSCLIEDGILSYLQGVQDKLLPGGQVITVDYCATTLRHVLSRKKKRMVSNRTQPVPVIPLQDTTESELSLR